MPVLVVGSVALDSVETPFGKREEILGGSATYFSMAASFFSPVRVVAVVGEDFPDAHLTMLTNRGVDLSGLVKRPGRTFRWKGRYTAQQLNEAQTLDTQLNVFEQFEPELPEPYRATPFVFLGNIDPVLQAKVLDQVAKPMLVAADTMNFWIRGKLDDLKKTLSRVDLLFVNDAEARELAGESNVVRAVRRIMDLGPKTVAVKRGEYGALLFHGEKVFSAPAFPLADVYDPTGAGDSFAGGFMGYLARCGVVTDEHLRRATIMGSVMASFAVEGFSMDRVKLLTEPEINTRFGSFRALTQFEELSPGPLRQAG
ncbi:MAG TPA: PfkB family carbohydrate kinase [Myxococcales bacterium]|jgi:sugar/nucleoside kinase (ribokinase family)